MRLRQARKRFEASEGGVLPLINIVFLLLIFFLLAGRVAQPEAADVKPPSSVFASGDPAAPSMLEVTATGEIRYLGEPADLARAATSIAKQAREAEAAVVIRADMAAPAERVLAAAAALRRARVEQSKLVVEIARPSDVDR